MTTYISLAGLGGLGGLSYGDRFAIAGVIVDFQVISGKPFAATPRIRHYKPGRQVTVTTDDWQSIVMHDIGRGSGDWVGEDSVGERDIFCCYVDADRVIFLERLGVANSEHLVERGAVEVTCITRVGDGWCQADPLRPGLRCHAHEEFPAHCWRRPESMR